MQQKEDPNAVWKFPEEITLSSTSGEVVVGGVYLRLLVANPSWVLRKPKQFTSDLFDTLLDLLAKGGNDVSTVPAMHFNISVFEKGRSINKN